MTESNIDTKKLAELDAEIIRKRELNEGPAKSVELPLARKKDDRGLSKKEESEIQASFARADVDYISQNKNKPDKMAKMKKLLIIACEKNIRLLNETLDEMEELVKVQQDDHEEVTVKILEIKTELLKDVSYNLKQTTDILVEIHRI